MATKKQPKPTKPKQPTKASTKPKSTKTKPKTKSVKSANRAEFKTLTEEQQGIYNAAVSVGADHDDAMDAVYQFSKQVIKPKPRKRKPVQNNWTEQQQSAYSLAIGRGATHWQAIVDAGIQTDRKPQVEKPIRISEGTYVYRGYSICHGNDVLVRSGLEPRLRGWFWLDDKNRRRRASSLTKAVASIRSYIEFKAERG